ncbi:ABC transporter ATP-binding protein [Leucobacter sp. gxy201]|uniref:ABC transporter ATP-binding protein n=1 Tax=Leucobacter sp. gxy201 TaxID=2957200 RepID=UPI003DA1B117
MSTLELEGVSKDFGQGFAVQDLDLRVESGESVVLLGPSGCGKTTTLRMIAGFETPTAGRIAIGEREVVGARTNVPPEGRGIGMVFQSYALWPHLTVAENVAFGLTTTEGRKRLRRNRSEIATSVERALDQVQLAGYGARYPHELSGGQQQRVALARALVVDPEVLLLDEPLSNLDTRLREEMRNEIRRLQLESGITMVYITHDRSEALGLADRIVCLDAGRIQQIDPPERMYRRPATRFVARTLGQANALDLTVEEVGAATITARLQGADLVRLDAADAPDACPGDRLPVCVRPVDVLLDFDDPRTNANVRSRSFLGDETHYVIDFDGVDEPVRAIDRRATHHPAGSRLRLSVDETRISVLTGELEERRVDALV